MATLELELPKLCGQLLVAGFDGAELTPRFERALRDGRRGGAILFRRNLPDVWSSARLCESIRSASEPDLPPFISVDQEGGRVTRMPAPFLTLPPMRELGRLDNLDLVRRAARAVAVELAAVGFNLNFAPILDVDSNPANPVIGDRAFGRDPRTVMRNAVAFLQGLQDKNVLACGKHFPGTGTPRSTATSISPSSTTIARASSRSSCRRSAPPPAQGIASFMTAHVVVEALDPGVPATLSRAICASLLRAEVGSEGVLFSDDLEMAAVAARYTIEESAVEAVWAGCDALLVCKSEDLADRAHEALVKKAESDRNFEIVASRPPRAASRCGGWFPRPFTSRTALEETVGGAAGKSILEEIAATSEAQRRLLS